MNYNGDMMTADATSTEIKLGEAEFFLNEMKNNLQNTRILSYYVSAFVSAARSVTLFMQKEYSRTPGFDEWYSRQVESMKQDPIWKFFNDQRQITIHKEPIKSNRSNDKLAFLQTSFTALAKHKPSLKFKLHIN